MEAAGFFVIILPTLGLTSVVSGLVAGGLQFLALRRWLERPRTWIPWTILAWILAWLGPFIVLILSKSDIDTPPLLGLTGMVAGAIMGTCQWMVLRRTVKAAIWWIPASALGWALGLFMLYFVRGDSLLRIAAAASMVSMVTGFALVVLLVRPAHGVKTPRSWR